MKVSTPFVLLMSSKEADISLTEYTKFNFMFFFSSNAPVYYKIMLHDAFALSNVRAMDTVLNKTDKGLNINFVPYRPANNPAAFKNPQAFNANDTDAFAKDFPVKNPIVFFFWANDFNTLRSFNFFNYLRKNYPGCKLVCWLTNPVHHYQQFLKLFTDKAATNEFISTFDCVLTYNLLDVIDYGFTYMEGPYSVFPCKQPNTDIDIFYVGAPKNRIEKILRAYESFKAAGFVCDFYIGNVYASVPSRSDLHFGEYLPYTEALARVLRSKAVLDIAHTRNYGLTLRHYESLAYNKIFITDNTFYRQERFASPKLFLIDKSLEIDKEKFMHAAELPSNYKNEYSPLRLISFLESVLNS